MLELPAAISEAGARFPHETVQGKLLLAVSAPFTFWMLVTPEIMLKSGGFPLAAASVCLASRGKAVPTRESRGQ
jgi:hypothetical protein